MCTPPASPTRSPTPACFSNTRRSTPRAAVPRRRGAPAGRHPRRGRGPRRQDHLARPGPARRLPDPEAAAPGRRGRAPAPPGGRADPRSAPSSAWRPPASRAAAGVWVLGDAKDATERAPEARRPVPGLRPPGERRRVRPPSQRPGVRALERRPAPRGPQDLRAMGIRVAKGVTMHGFALNVNPDNTWIRPDRAVRHPRRGRHLALVRAGPRGHDRRGAAGRGEATCARSWRTRRSPRASSRTAPEQGARRGDRPERECTPKARGWPHVRPIKTTGVPWCSPKNRSCREPVVSAVAPDGRKMLRLEVRNSQTPIERKPEWIKTRAKMGPEYTKMQSLVKSEGLHTVCQEAGCPNIYECWEDREATFLIGGDQCTRRCDFCQIDTGKPAGAGPRRAAPRRRVRRHDGPELRHDHRRRPRRPGGRRRLAVRGDRAPDPRA